MLKVWRLPISAPNGRGKALVNLLPLDEGERITSVVPLPEDKAQWETLDVLFATNAGTIRRNKLSDCVPRTSLGKRVMEFEDQGQRIVGVQLGTEADDVLLTSRVGQCIRFPVDAIRVFGGNGSTGTSMGVRGIDLGDGDEVISMALLRHFEATPDERAGYLKRRRAVTGEGGEEASEEEATAVNISQERYVEMSAAEQIVLTVSENGYGKRTSSFEYRITNRGGKGIVAMVVNERNGGLIASFPVEDSDQIMLVTNGGQLIRTPVKDIRVAGRSTQGVIVFDTHAAETVVSVERVSDAGEAEDEADAPEA